VDFTAFVTLEARHPQICIGPNLIWNALSPYAAAAAALVRRLRLSGHLDYLAPPAHSQSVFVTATLRSSSSRLPVRSGPDGAGGAGGAGAPRSMAAAGSGGERGKPSVPLLALPGLRDEKRGQPGAHAARGVPRGAYAADDDDLDGFAAWAATHADASDPGGGGRQPPRELPLGGGLAARRADFAARGQLSMPRSASPSRGPPVLQRSNTMPLGPYSEYEERSSAMRGASPPKRASSPSRPRMVDPELSEIMAVLAARAKSPQKAPNRITADYYARMNEVAATRTRVVARNALGQ
jgi:hypothetical protein